MALSKTLLIGGGQSCQLETAQQAAPSAMGRTTPEEEKCKDRGKNIFPRSLHLIFTSRVHSNQARFTDSFVSFFVTAAARLNGAKSGDDDSSCVRLSSVGKAKNKLCSFAASAL